MKDWGPNDKVAKYKMDLPWALQYIMSMPDELMIRFISKKDWPEADSIAYAIVPYDME